MVGEVNSNFDLRESRRKEKDRLAANKRRIPKFRYLIIPGVILIVGMYLLSRYASITSLNMEITQLEKQKENLIKERTNLEAKLEEIKFSDNISADAKIKLGMDKPNVDQVIYLETESIRNTD